MSMGGNQDNNNKKTVETGANSIGAWDAKSKKTLVDKQVSANSIAA